ncbi:hypothetical protein QQ045_010066 [Rhodiola kirilowii]
MAWRQGFRYISSAESYRSLEIEEHHQFFQHSPAQFSTHRLSDPSSVSRHQPSRGFVYRYNGEKEFPDYMYERVTTSRVENYSTSSVQPQPEYQPPPQVIRPTARPSGRVIDSNQAAKLYGGLLVNEYYPTSRTKVVRKAYY